MVYTVQQKRACLVFTICLYSHTVPIQYSITVQYISERVYKKIDPSGSNSVIGGAHYLDRCNFGGLASQIMYTYSVLCLLRSVSPLFILFLSSPPPYLFPSLSLTRTFFRLYRCVFWSCILSCFVSFLLPLDTVSFFISFLLLLLLYPVLSLSFCF